MPYSAEITAVLNSKHADSDMLNVVEVLGYPPADFQKAFDVALEMENKNLVKLLYSNFNAGKVMVEFTLVGKTATQSG